MAIIGMDIHRAFAEVVALEVNRVGGLGGSSCDATGSQRLRQG